jgi:hypothetical protein
MTRLMQTWMRTVAMAAALLTSSLPFATARAETAQEKLKREARAAEHKLEDGAKNTEHKLEDAGHKSSKSIKTALSPENLKKKLKVANAEFEKIFSREDGKLWIHWGKGDKERAQLDTRLGATKGQATKGGAGDVCTSSLHDGGPGAQGLPASVLAYADYYNGKGGKAPAKSVSHRGKQSSVDDQASRGTCTAFASAAAIEAVNGRKKLSKEYLYWLTHGRSTSDECNDEGTVISHASEMLRQDGVPEDVHWVYLPFVSKKNHICPIGPSAIARSVHHFQPKQIIDIPGGGDGKTGAWFNNPLFLEAVLDSGHDIVSGHCVAWGNKTAWLGLLDHQGVLDVITDDSGQPHTAHGGHAMLIVGYEHTGDASHGGGYILVKNSWGLLTGDGGYMKLSYDYVRDYGIEGWFIEGGLK